MKYQEILNQGSKILKLNNIKSYNLDSEILLSKIIKKDRSQLLLNLDNKIDEIQKELKFQTLIFFKYIFTLLTLSEHN